MALFGSAKKKKIAELERDALANPDPAKMTGLIEACIAADDRAKALEIATKALSLFPRVESVRAAWQNVKRLELQPQIIELQAAIQRSPTSKQFEMLANIYLRDLNDADKAHEIVLKGLAAFPSDEGLHFIAGIVRMGRFHKEFLANDFNEAVDHFRKTVETNPMNYKALVALGRLYAVSGQRPEALECFRKAKQMNETDGRVDAILEWLNGKGEGDASVPLDEKLQGIESQRRLGPDGEAIVKIFEPTYVRQETMRIERPKAQQYLGDLQRYKGFKAAVLLDRSGTVTASESSAWDKIGEFGRVVARLAGTSEDASHRMDIGGITHVGVVTPSGRIILTISRSFMMGVLLDKDAREEDVVAIVDRFRSSFI